MVIAIDIRSETGEYGGIPSYTKNIVSHLLALRCRHTFVLFSNSFKMRTIDEISYQQGVKTVNYRIPNKLFSFCLSFFQRPYLDILVQKKIGKKVDLWFSPNLNFIALSPQCALVITAHDLSYEFFPQFFSVKMRFWHRIVGPRRIFRRANHVIAVSHHTKNDLVSTYGLASDKVSVVYHGVATNNKKPILSNRYILMVGAGSKRKNLHTLIEAFHQMKRECPDLADVKLIVTGLHDKIVNDIIYMGYISKMLYLDLIGRAQLLVYPSFYEGFGLPLLEAFAASTAVIASAHSSLAEIGNDAFFPIDPYNTESLTHALKEVLRDKSLRDYLTDQGLKRAHEFSWDLAAQQTLKAFEQCVPI